MYKIVQSVSVFNRRIFVAPKIKSSCTPCSNSFLKKFKIKIKIVLFRLRCRKVWKIHLKSDACHFKCAKLISGTLPPKMVENGVVLKI